MEKEVLHLFCQEACDLSPLDQVEDEYFRQGYLGQGFAMSPKENKIPSPLAGRVCHLPETVHSVGIEASNGAHVLVHFGLETVHLKGKGIQSKVKLGDQVQVGETLLEFDDDILQDYEKITLVVVTNIDSFTYEINLQAEKGKPIMTLCRI